jgi:hypothetical protein
MINANTIYETGNNIWDINMSINYFKPRGHVSNDNDMAYDVYMYSTHCMLYISRHLNTEIH